MSYRNQQFEQEFNKEFNGRFRIRWSDIGQEYLIEQKVGSQRVLEPPTRADGSVDTFADEYVRARDGYFYVMTVRPGTKMPCPICGLAVDVPVMMTAESFCPYCKVMGRDARYKAAYYPLNHILIEHIKDIDPERDGVKRVRERLRAAQIKRNAQMFKNEMDDVQHHVDFNKNQIDETPMVGYGPKTAQRHDSSRMDL